MVTWWSDGRVHRPCENHQRSPAPAHGSLPNSGRFLKVCRLELLRVTMAHWQCALILMTLPSIRRGVDADGSAAWDPQVRLQPPSQASLGSTPGREWCCLAACLVTDDAILSIQAIWSSLIREQANHQRRPRDLKFYAWPVRTG